MTDKRQFTCLAFQVKLISCTLLLILYCYEGKLFNDCECQKEAFLYHNNQNCTCYTSIGGMTEDFQHLKSTGLIINTIINFSYTHKTVTTGNGVCLSWRASSVDL